MSSLPLHPGIVPVSMFSLDDQFGPTDFRWGHRFVELADFAEIRHYADCCLEGKDPSGRWLLEALSPDLDALDGVLWELDQIIPWFTEAEEARALDHLPARPESLPPPRTAEGGIVKQTAVIYHQWKEKQDRIEELQKYWDTNVSDLRERVELGRRIKTRRTEHLVKKNAITRLRSRIRERKEVGEALSSAQVVNWVILPGGEPIWTRISSSVEAIRSRHPARQLDPSRLEKIVSLQPEAVYLGAHEFDGYFVFLFKHSGVAVLECPWVGNAIYVIHGDWRQLSRLTKSDLLHRHHRQVRRIIHHETGDWFSKLEKCLR